MFFFFSENLNYAPNIREIQVIFVVSFPYIFLSKRIRNLINGKAITLLIRISCFQLNFFHKLSSVQIRAFCLVSRLLTCNLFHEDVDDVKFVINFDYPNCSEDYVHRIGRTGRSSRTGTAYTFFTANNAKQAQDLIGVLTEANQVINPKLYELASSSRGGGGRGGMIMG